jgi:hypothetical protein
MSSDLSCSDFLKARHIWEITTMVTTKSKLQMEYSKKVTSAVWAIAGENLISLQGRSLVFWNGVHN